MLHDKDGVAEVAQRFQDIDEALRVAWMQTDGRFIQNIERSDEVRPQRRRQLNALRFAAGKRRGQAIKRKVIEAHFIEKLQPGSHFLQNLLGDLELRFRELQSSEKIPRLFYREFAKIGDRSSGNAHRAGFGTQARSATLRASGVAPVTAQENPHVELVLFPLQPLEKTFYSAEIVFRIAFQHETPLLGGKLAPGNVGGDPSCAGPFLCVLKQLAITRLGPGLDGA